MPQLTTLYNGLNSGEYYTVLGKEAAKTLLGHAEQSTTDIYLLDEVQESMKVAKALAKYRKEE